MIQRQKAKVKIRNINMNYSLSSKYNFYVNFTVLCCYEQRKESRESVVWQRCSRGWRFRAVLFIVNEFSKQAPLL
jgi:hypothetical protein